MNDGKWYDREFIDTVGKYIKEKTDDKDCIYVISDYGYKDLIYFIGNRKCCTRYPGFFRLTAPVPSGLTEDQKKSFANHPPVYFILWVKKININNYQRITHEYISHTGKKYEIEVNTVEGDECIILYRIIK